MINLGNYLGTFIYINVLTYNNLVLNCSLLIPRFILFNFLILNAL